MRSFSGWLSLALLVSVAGLCAEDSDIKVEAAGLRIVAPSADESMRAFNWTAGTTVSLLIASPKGGLIQFDGESSALTKFLDGKGNDLLAKSANGPRGFANPGFSMFPRISADGKVCTIEVNSQNLPAKGTTQIKVEGIVTMLCATRKTEHVQGNVTLKSGTKLTGPAGLELSIENVAKPDFGDEPLGLTLRSSKKLDDIADIKFFKADGSEIKCRRTGTSKMGIFGSLTVEWNYNLAEKVDAATVKIYMWSDMQKQRVPFSLDVGVGL